MRVFLMGLAALVVATSSASAQYGAMPASFAQPGYLQPAYTLSSYDDEKPMPPAPGKEGAQTHPAPIPADDYHAHGGYAPQGCGTYGGAPCPGAAGCGDCGYGEGCNCDPGFGFAYGPSYGCWLISASGLIMTRDSDDPLWTSFDANQINSHLLGSPDVDPDDWQGGFEVTIARRLGANSGISATYWGLDPDDNSRTITDAAGLIDSAVDFNRLDFAIGGPVNVLFDSAQAHRMSMSSEFHNVEVSLHHQMTDPCRRLSLNWLAGFRFFRFSEDLEFATSNNSTSFGVDRANEAYYNIDVENNLIGFQIGARADYQASCRCSLYADTRFGIFYNDIDHNSSLTSGTGEVAVDQIYGLPWQIGSNGDEFATLAQVDVGLQYHINCCWSAHIGYRLVAASGVALATDQVPQFVSDYYGIQDINSNGHLFLHGGVAGLSYSF